MKTDTLTEIIWFVIIMTIISLIAYSIHNAIREPEEKPSLVSQITKPSLVSQITKPEYLFTEVTGHGILKTVTGAVKVEEIKYLTTEEVVDENMNKIKKDTYEFLLSEGRYGGQIWRVTFADGTTKRYYYQYFKMMQWEYLPLDFWPYKN